MNGPGLCVFAGVFLTTLIFKGLNVGRGVATEPQVAVVLLTGMPQGIIGC